LNRLPDGERRRRALTATMAKYAGRPLDWRKSDCIRMLRSHLVAMGHRGLPPLPRYSTPLGAGRALKASGHDTIESLLDALLPRIAPSRMLLGDVALMQGEGSFDAVTLCIGYRLWGWHGAAEDDGPVDIRSGATNILAEVKAAYRA
jgi:hypothetical protein